MSPRVLVLGGTAPARRLASLLVNDPRFDVTTALAGRTTAPAEVAGVVRVGGFGGVDGLVAWLLAYRIDAVVDATHPFAAGITGHAVAATRRVGVPLVIVRRPEWRPRPGDVWEWVDTLSDVAEVLPGFGRRVFLSTGRSDLSVCARLPDMWFLVRSVDPPESVPPNAAFVRGRGPFAVADEVALLREHRIDVVVSRDSGGADAKLAAAREVGIPVVLIRRPALPLGVPTVGDEHAAVAWLGSVASTTMTDVADRD